MKGIGNIASSDSSQQNTGIIAKDGRQMHPNSLANMAKGRFLPSDPRINRKGRPRKEFAWTDVISQVGDEINPETLKTNRQSLVRDMYRIAQDPKTPPATRFSITVWLTEREEGRPKPSSVANSSPKIMPGGVILMTSHVQSTD